AIEYGLTYNDADRIAQTIPSVATVLPSRILRQDVWYRDRRVDCEVVGTLAKHHEMSHDVLQRGRFFTKREEDGVKNVCVIDSNMAKELFPIDDPIGNAVQVGSDYYLVVGVVQPRSAGQAQGAPGAAAPASNGGAQAAAFRMFIPLSAARERFGELVIKRSSGSMQAERVQLHELTVKVTSLDDVLETGRIIEDLIQRYHDKKDYEVTVPLFLLQQAERQKRIFNVVLGAIAAISLLVGGIGIMNIMLASVTERTREIGIRRALGAKRRDIVMQFLIETILLSGTGGIIGVALGLIIPIFVRHFADMKTIVTLWSPLAAFSISALVGLIFGLYPALRAADMDPVEALRHE
ncbi:MAG: ABC transporter permease, partial [FCB group bacterium]|nr:ABC transporter permease [FCB group bacterium]